MSWIKYGSMVAVASGIFIGGGIALKEYRFVEGERVAEWAAAVQERQMGVDSYMGGNFTFSTGDVIKVSSFIRWDTMYDDIMSGARSLALRGTWVLRGYSGDAVTNTTAGSYWYATTNPTTTPPTVTWQCTAPTDRISRVPVLSTVTSTNDLTVHYDINPAWWSLISYVYGGGGLKYGDLPGDTVSGWFYSDANLSPTSSLGVDSGWEHVGLGTDLFLFSCDVPKGLNDSGTEYEYATKQSVSSNNFIEAQALLQSMTNSVHMILAPAAIGAGTRYKYEYLSTNLPPIYNGGRYTVGDVVAEVNGFPWVPTETNYYRSTSVGPLFSIRLGAGVSYYDSGDGYTSASGEAKTTGVYGLYIDPGTATYSYSNIRLDFPSLYALTNGYVNSVSIYAVYTVSTANRYGQSDPTGGDSSYTFTAFDADDTTPGKYEDYLFGFVPGVRHRPGFPSGVGAYPAVTVEVGTVEYVDAVAYLLETVDCTEATTNVTFSIEAPDLSDIVVPQEDYQSWHYAYTKEDPPGVTKAYETTGLGFDMTVSISHFIISVDWNWKHLNPDVPFVPENNMPPWAIVTPDTP